MKTCLYIIGIFIMLFWITVYYLIHELSKILA